MKSSVLQSTGWAPCFLALLALLPIVVCQSNDTIGLAGGFLNFTTSNFRVGLVKDSQLLASLQSPDEPFNFSPTDYLLQRSANGNYHTGDITLRYRTDGGQNWTSADSASARARVTSNSVDTSLVALDLNPTLPGLTDLSIDRQWIDVDGDLGVVFTITNVRDTTLEIGSLGFPLEFNSILTGREASEVEQNCSFQDPYIGLDAGYVQVTPIGGVGPALVVSPLNETKFEAWRFLPENENAPLGYQTQTFEGFYEFQVYTSAWAENEWKNVTPWNAPTSRFLQPQACFAVGLRFSLASGGIEDIQDTVIRAGLPYAQSVPGYIIPNDTTSILTINSTSDIVAFTTSPDDAFSFENVTDGFALTPTANISGHVRLTVRYADGRNQSIHYNIVKPAPVVVQDLGRFSTTVQFFNDTSDPFDRAPSILTWDREVNDFVTQDPRVWIAGLSDEGGAGSWLAAAMKQYVQPNALEVARLEEFIHETLWGVLQIRDGPDAFGVRKSLFYYDPEYLPDYEYDPAINWTSSMSWNRTQAYSIPRAYNYVHVSAAYWALYRVARAYPQLMQRANWSWYLNQSFQTVMKCTETNSTGQLVISYAEDGLMGETVWGELLKDLYREGMTGEAQQLEQKMRLRAEHWDSLDVPFGSEMAWDSTGQEGVWYWANYFGLNNTAIKAINSIKGYTPTVPHWGWNGNSRRYWDFVYAAKIRRFERQIHHYGSGLNALPMLAHFRQNPTDLYALRVGYAGISGPLSNVDEEGFASAAFHSFPDTLAWDPYTGDYGPNFLGLALGTGTYVVEHPSLGLVAYGGEVARCTNTSVTIEPKDPLRRRVYLAQYGLSMEINSGLIERVTVDSESDSVTLSVVSCLGISGACSYDVLLWVDSYTGREFNVSTTNRCRGGWSLGTGGQDGSISVTLHVTN